MPRVECSVSQRQDRPSRFDRLAVVQRFGDGGEAAQLGVAVPPDRGFEHADAAAEEDAEAVARRRLEPAHPDVAAEAAQAVDRHQAGAQREAEIARRLAAGPRELDAGLRDALRRHQHDRAVAAEQEGDGHRRAEIAQARDAHGRHEIDRLVEPSGDRTRRVDDVGHRERPVGRRRPEAVRLEGVAFAREQRQPCEEAG